MSHDDAQRFSRHPIAEARLRQPPPIYVGHCAATRQVQAAVLRAVRSPGPVLVIGAPGTGKRTVAEILHHFGGGARDIVEPTIEDGRVLGLGEFTYVCPVEQLSLAQQLELVSTPVRGRLVLGTRLDPNGDEGRRRLHPKLASACLQIPLPSLRERIEDLEPLAMRIIGASPSRRPIGGINDYALDCLRAHPWPGNVSELEEVLRAAIEVGTTEQIELRDLPPSLRLRAVQGLDLQAPDFQFSLIHAERTAVERAMRYARGNKRKAARLLKIGKSTLYRKLRLFDSDDDPELDDE